MRMLAGAVVLLALSGGAAAAQTPAPGLPTRTALAEHAARRFPQPVRAGSLVGRDLLQPEESQPVLGRVQAVVRGPDGGIDLIVRTGSVLGLGGHKVAVPVEAIALLGEHVALIDYTPAQLASLPAAPPAPGLPPSETIEVGLVKPFH